MSNFVIHAGREGYGVREVSEDLLVFASSDATSSSAAYLATFLNAHARHVPAHRVRTLLVELGSDLRSIPTPPSAVQPQRQERSA